MKNKLFVFLLLVSGLVLSTAPSLWASSVVSEEIKFIAIQHNGRVKPLDAFARQTLKIIAGRETWRKQPAISVLFEALSHPDKIANLEWIRIDYFELKNSLGLPVEKTFFSLNELSSSLPKIQNLVRASKAKRDQDVRPTKLEQKAEQLLTQTRTVDNLISGEALRLLPPQGDNGEWLSPFSENKLSAGNFSKNIETALKNNKNLPPPLKTKLALEVWYYKLRPFECAAVFYFLGFLGFALFERKKALLRLGIFFIFAALSFHTLGIGLRVYILSRPPVSNMYESMIFMNWALMVYASFFAVVRKNSLAIATGSIISALVMIYANLLPIDSSLDVLVPVLRSNYWLTIHVMTIVSSYGAFGLAMALGHRHLFAASFGKLDKKSEEDSASLIFRVIQLGTLLIGTGTFLGGVWANESWGRFWGWDPKETWALITFLGYLIIVHLKYAKKINDFYLALSAVVGFLLVLMTWYGVNFVLGRGLHSYGAGSGGMRWVVYYLIFEGLFVSLIIYRSFGSLQKESRPASTRRK